MLTIFGPEPYEPGFEDTFQRLIKKLDPPSTEYLLALTGFNPPHTSLRSSLVRRADCKTPVRTRYLSRGRPALRTNG
jgi:hypothetical protein